jgi:putative nucleotidyltransferase with HDIG domain
MTPFERHTYDLLRRVDFQRLALWRDHHFRRNRLAHSITVAKLAYQTARILRADIRVTTRAALLHDWYFECREEHENRIGANVHHFRISAVNARGLGESGAVIHAIETHMWPYGRIAPKTKEAWIVWMTDNIVWIYDGLNSVYNLLRWKVHVFLYGPDEGIPNAT